MADETPTPKPPRNTVINIEHLVDTVLFHAGGEPCHIAHCPDGHSGGGYYVWSTEYSEEGASFLCRDVETLCRITEALAQRIEPKAD